MTNPTSDLDRIIRDSLRHDETDLLDRFGEQSTGELLLEPFRGRRRFTAVTGLVGTLLLFATAIILVGRFLQAEDQRSMLIWGASAAFCLGSVMIFKVWYWLEMARLALARDIKRVELQVALLAQQLADRPNPNR